MVKPKPCSARYFLRSVRILTTISHASSYAILRQRVFGNIKAGLRALAQYIGDHQNQAHYSSSKPGTMQIQPPRSALLVIDMQKFFSSMVEDCMPNVLRLLNAITNETCPVPVLFTQHGHSKEELAMDPCPNQLVRKLKEGTVIKVGDEAWEFLPELNSYLPSTSWAAKLSPDDHPAFPLVIPKNTYDSFMPSPKFRDAPLLSNILEAAQVERLIICGVMTDVCVDSTARAAFCRGYETWVVSDACGSETAKQHETGLHAQRMLCGPVMKTDEVLKKLQVEGFLK